MKHLIAFFVVFLLLAACATQKEKDYSYLYDKDSKYDISGKSPSPFVGIWRWVYNKPGVTSISVDIGERNDSLFIAVYAKLPYAWLFLPGYYGDPTKEIYSPYICMQRPQKGNKAVVVYSHSPTNEKSVPRYNEVSLKLKDENTLEWKVKLSEEMNIPTKMVFKRESKRNYKFGPRVPFMYVNKGK